MAVLDQLIRINDKNANDAGVSNLLNQAPFLAALEAIPASNGTMHKYLKETAAPTAGFRTVNVGVASDESTDVLVTADLAIVDATVTRDIALARGYSKGEDAYMARESLRALRAGFFAVEQQVLNGQAEGDDSGFEGFADALDGLSDAGVVNAGGSASLAASSIYLVRSTPDETGVMAVVGNDGEITIGEQTTTRVTSVADSDGSGKGYAAYMIPIIGWVGVQIGGTYSVVRICNVTTDSGKGATDDLIYSGISKFKASEPPTHIVMNRRSVEQLRASRTATNATGAPAPIPTEVNGIPIIVTDALKTTEAIVA